MYIYNYNSNPNYLINIRSNLGYAFFSKPGSWQIAGWWAGATNTLYSLAAIAYNANLVDIANNHWLIRRGIRINASQKKGLLN